MWAPTSVGESRLTNEKLRSHTMYESYNPFLQSEIDYRRDRLRASAVPRKNRHPRFPRVRRAVSTDNIR
jgi:hypothetical protein